MALNYQTLDTSQITNSSLFEQNGNLGYVLKPSVLWNKQHPEYGKFNPFEKKKDGDYTLLKIKLISGQYLIENISQISTSSNNSHHKFATELLQTTSTFVEIEIIGIPCDCAKEKTKTCNKNALNPIWNEEFSFDVKSFKILKSFNLTIMSNYYRLCSLNWLSLSFLLSTVILTMSFRKELFHSNVCVMVLYLKF